MTAVKFIRDHDRYFSGEIAGFRPREAERLVRRGIARLYMPAAEVSSRKSGDPGPETNQHPSAAELLATVDTPEFDWNTFQQGAHELLGDDAPRDKAGLIAALRAFEI